MKLIKSHSKIIATFISIVIIMSSTIIIKGQNTTTTLKDGSTLTITTNTPTQRIVNTTSPNGNTSTITYLKQKNQLTINSNAKERTININMPPILPDNEPPIRGAIIAKKSESWTGFAYRVRQLTPKNRWWLKTNQGQKVRYANTANIFNLRGFMASVDKMAQAELQCYSMCSGTLLSSIASVLTAMLASGILSPIAIVAGAILAVGGSLSIAYVGADYLEGGKKAKYYYALV